MRFRVVGVHPDSGEGIDIVIEAPDLAWAQRMVRQRGIVIDSIDPAPRPREPAGPVKLDRFGPGGSTLGGRALTMPEPAEPAATVATAEIIEPAPVHAQPIPPAPSPHTAPRASWILWSAVAAAVLVLGLIVWLVR